MKTEKFAAVLSGLAVLGGTLVMSTDAASAGTHAAAGKAAPHATCKAHWKRNGTLMTDKKSPWYNTARDINGWRRQIQFHVASGYTAAYKHHNCKWGPTHSFASASKYRLAGRAYGGHTKWYESTSGPKRKYKYPDACAGWDEFKSRWLVWRGSGCH